MPHKCIYSHTHVEFVMWNHIQAYKCDMNVYGPLWTRTCICAIWTYFLIILNIFSFLISFQKTFPIITESCMSSPSYILLFVTHSPVICKDFFSLVHMYKLSRYYPVFNINLGPIFPQSTILF